MEDEKMSWLNACREQKERLEVDLDPFVFEGHDWWQKPGAMEFADVRELNKKRRKRWKASEEFQFCFG